jgi:hypothetical protein
MNSYVLQIKIIWNHKNEHKNHQLMGYTKQPYKFYLYIDQIVSPFSSDKVTIRGVN